MSKIRHILSIVNDLNELQKKALTEIANTKTTHDVKQLELHYLGKQGVLNKKMKLLGTLSSEEKPAFGKILNEFRNSLTEALNKKNASLKNAERQIQYENERIDSTLPAAENYAGLEHILQQTANKIKKVFIGLGFEYLESPELEEFRNNFSALNYPPDHPAMDEQDTFYVNEQHLLRTQCTALQPHVLKVRKPPLKVFTIGKCFRNEALDRTHSHTFHQVDAFMIDENISLAHLKATLKIFTKAMFGEEVIVRFRPDFFPFVEPGVDYAIKSPKFNNGQWLEWGGAGMMHPSILEAFDIDTEKYTGWAFGFGIERIPMLAYGVDDLRLFLENDLRFLEQF